MQHVDDASSTLTEEVWQEVVHQTPATPAAPWRPESRVSRFFLVITDSVDPARHRSASHKPVNSPANYRRSACR